MSNDIYSDEQVATLVAAMAEGFDPRQITSREHAEAEKAAKVAAQQVAARNARKLMDSAATVAANAVAKVADKYYAIGSLMVASGLSDRAFAVIAEHGTREAFDLLELAQPRRLSSYRRARVIYAACDASGSDIGETVELFTSECRERGEDGSITLREFADYCARGFKFDDSADREPTAPAVTIASLLKLDKLNKRDAAKLAALVAGKLSDPDSLYRLSDALTDAADAIAAKAAKVAAAA